MARKRVLMSDRTNADRTSQNRMTDTLSEVLAVTRLKGTVYFSAELRAPWGVTLPRRSRSPFYAVTQGRCEITLDGAPSPGVSLGPGGLVVLPGGMGHTLASSSTVTASPLDQFVARYPMDDAGHLKVLDGSGPTTSLIGGFFELERAPDPLVAILPPIIHLPAEDPEVDGWLDPILRSIASEAAQALPGRAVVLNRLADVLFVRVVRACLLKMAAASATRPPSWLSGLTDPRISRALAQIHGAPERPGRSPTWPPTRRCRARPSRGASMPSWDRRRSAIWRRGACKRPPTCSRWALLALRRSPSAA